MFPTNTLQWIIYLCMFSLMFTIGMVISAFTTSAAGALAITLLSTLAIDWAFSKFVFPWAW
jgi:hypothetical protein